MIDGWNARSRARSACDGAPAPPRLLEAPRYVSLFMKCSTKQTDSDLLLVFTWMENYEKWGCPVRMGVRIFYPVAKISAGVCN